MKCNKDHTYRPEGFTLVELMIVVAIVAVLATVAVVAYVRYIRSGRLVDARAFLSSIQARQSTYFQHHGQYCNASGQTSSAAFHPPLLASEPQPKLWNPSTFGGDATIGWQQLGARPENDQTFMATFVQASDPAADHALQGKASDVGIPPQPTTAAADGTPPTKHPWWYAVAHLDLDGSGERSAGGCADMGTMLTTQACTVLWTSSAKGQIVVLNEGK